MLFISFDALGDAEFDILQTYPAFSAFVQTSAIYRNVSSLFVSNTYPVHTSIATGLSPDLHGLISNNEPFPFKDPLWNNSESCIRAKTLWQAASEKGIKTAAVFWPVTAYSQSINYNVPEVLARPGESQLMTSLKAGSKWLQLTLFLKYRKLLKGVKQPELDNFATACMTHILCKKKPGLAFIHLTAFDFLCHEHGKGSPELIKAYEALDKNLAALLKAAGDQRDIILFSDHSQINVHTVVDPNKELVDRGYLISDTRGYLPGEYSCFFECCGGSAFFHKGTLAPDVIEDIRNIITRSKGFKRFLSHEELRISGYDHACFGFCAKPGYCYGKNQSKEKANHGYPLDMPAYNVFYMIKGKGIKPGVNQNGSLLDIAPFAAERLGVNL